MDKIIRNSIVLLLVFVIVSCNHDKKSDDAFNELSKEFNILGLKPTSYLYDGCPVYVLGNPNRTRYNGFGIGYLLFLRNGVINMVYIDRNCYEQYKAGHYQFKEWNDSNGGGIDPCNVMIYPFVDLKQAVGDTMFLFTTKGERSDFWSSLVSKFYSLEIRDTICEFKRQLGKANMQERVYYISKNVGIVGMANIQWGMITDSIGYPFFKEAIHVPLDTLNVDILKYIENIKE